MEKPNQNQRIEKTKELEIPWRWRWCFRVGNSSCLRTRSGCLGTVRQSLAPPSLCVRLPRATASLVFPNSDSSSLPLSHLLDSRFALNPSDEVEVTGERKRCALSSRLNPNNKRWGGSTVQPYRSVLNWVGFGFPPVSVRPNIRNFDLGWSHGPAQPIQAQ